jgi:thioredoxin 1
LLSPILEKLTDDPNIKAGSGQALDLITIDTQSPEGQKISMDYKVR